MGIKNSTGAICGAVLVGFGLVLPAWILFIGAGGRFDNPAVVPLMWVASWLLTIIGAVAGVLVAEEINSQESTP